MAKRSVGLGRVEDIVELDLTDEERASLAKSADIIKRSVAAIDLG